MSGCWRMSILTVRLTRAALRRDALLNCNNIGVLDRGSCDLVVNWANPLTSCSNFSMFILAAMYSKPAAASHVPQQCCEIVPPLNPITSRLALPSASD
jgi:hypothetical protein